MKLKLHRRFRKLTRNKTQKFLLQLENWRNLTCKKYSYDILYLGQGTRGLKNEDSAPGQQFSGLIDYMAEFAESKDGA